MSIPGALAACCVVAEDGMGSANDWTGRAAKLREAASMARDRLEQQTLVLLAEDCDEIAKHQQAKDEETD